MNRHLILTAAFLSGALALSACNGGAQNTGCAMYDKLSWLVDTANTKFAGKYASDVKMVEDAAATAACTTGDWQVRAEAAASRLVKDLWQL